jgi:hypothetical protein
LEPTARLAAGEQRNSIRRNNDFSIIGLPPLPLLGELRRRGMLER